MAAICVFCASSRRLDQRWLELARQTGRELARRGHILVSGGGRVGMMGAVAEGSRAAGGRTVGVIPRALVEMEVADTYVDELVVTEDMSSRKSVMIDRSDAFLTLPGGLGTLDELFEVWTTAGLGVHAKPVALVSVDGFYAGLAEWLHGLAGTAFVRPESMELMTVAGSLPVALDAIEARLAGARLVQQRPAELGLVEAGLAEEELVKEGLVEEGLGERGTVPG